MKSKLIYLFLLIAIVVATQSCKKDEPCSGACPTGFICENDVCVVDPNFDPCAGVTCGANQECVNGTCEDIAFGVEVLSGIISANKTLSADKIYELASKVYVASGVTLTIEAGTVIKGREGLGSLATALVITKGAKINAQGTAAKPIIFTSVLDDIKPGQIAGTNLDEKKTGLWGGLVVLGNAPISATNGDTETQIEGIPADVLFGKYGGTDVADNSGVLKYVSIRHAGALIGDGNELNGLTLGGVGTGTVVDHIEVVANLDDGIEIFGGTVNVSNVVIAFQGDDALDIDQNYAGTIDNFYIIHGGADTDEALELDGPENTTYKDGKYTIKNGTAIAVDQTATSAADIKSKAQGTIENVSFKGYSTGKFLAIKASFVSATDCTEKSDSYINAKGGKLIFKNLQVVTPNASDALRVYTDTDRAACLDAVKTEYETLVDGLYSSNGGTAVATATNGANKIEFQNWTWTSAKNKLQ